MSKAEKIRKEIERLKAETFDNKELSLEEIIAVRNCYNNLLFFIDSLEEELEEQGEQNDSDVKDYNSIDPHFAKPIDKVELNFKVGDWVMYCGKPYQITGLHNDTFTLTSCDGSYFFNNVKSTNEPVFHLWTIQDAKVGDVLATKAGGIFIYKELLYDKPFAYCGVDKFGVFKDCNCGKGLDWTPYLSDVTPATKEQRDLLFQKMKEAGYEWDTEKKELKEIEDEEYNGEDYGIDGLWHAQRILEKTLGKVSGYQTDDGILEHKCAIAAVNKLYKQKPDWSEEDENTIKVLMNIIRKSEMIDSIIYTDSLKEKLYDWLKSLRPQKQWKPTKEQMDALLFVVQHYTPNVTDKLAWDSIKILELMYYEIKQ